MRLLVTGEILALFRINFYPVPKVLIQISGYLFAGIHLRVNASSGWVSTYYQGYKMASSSSSCHTKLLELLFFEFFAELTSFPFSLSTHFTLSWRISEIRWLWGTHGEGRRCTFYNVNQQSAWTTQTLTRAKGETYGYRERTETLESPHCTLFTLERSLDIFVDWQHQ